MNHEEFGTSDDYFRAFEALLAEGIPEKHSALLRAHHAAPEHTATWARLAAAVGYAGGSAVNLQYGKLAGRVAEELGIVEAPRGFWLYVLAGWADELDPVSGHTAFTLRRPVIEALSRLGVLAAGSERAGRASIAGVPGEEIDHGLRWSQVLTTEQYLEGFLKISVSELQRRILEAHYYAAACTASTAELARSACIRGGHPAVNSLYGRLGRAFMAANGYSPDHRRDGSQRLWSAFSLGRRTERGYVWEMLPEVAQALERLGWVTPGAQTLGEEAPTEAPLREGTAYQIVVNAFERSPVARRLCIEHHGPRCIACGFDFQATYGSVATGFIHVHHVVPLSQIQREYIVDPVRDLQPVCANCHAMIHLGGACRSVEEIRALIENARSAP